MNPYVLAGAGGSALGLLIYSLLYKPSVPFKVTMTAKPVIINDAAAVRAASALGISPPKAIYHLASVGATLGALITTPRGPVPVSGPVQPVSWLSPGSYLAVQEFGIASELTANNGSCRLVLQGVDGNLVLLRADGAILWNAVSQGRGIVRFLMRADGALVGIDTNGNVQWDSGTGGHARSILALQDDGNLVIYQGPIPIWATNTDGWRGSQRANKDIFDAIGAALSDVSDCIDDLGGALESISIVGDVADFIINAVKDFAQSDVGKAFLRCASAGVVAVLFAVPFIGPVIAPFGYAMPGLLRGERFDIACANELVAGVTFIASKAGGDLAKDILPADLTDNITAVISPLLDKLQNAARQCGAAPANLLENVSQSRILNTFAASLGIATPIDPINGIDSIVTAYAGANGMPEIIVRMGIDQIVGLTPPADLASLYDAQGKRKPIVHMTEVARKIKLFA